MMKHKQITSLAFGLLALTSPAANAAGVIVDGGFEAAGPLVDDGNGVGKWNPFAGTPATFAISTTSANSGAQSLELSMQGASNTFAGVFQDISVLPGETITFGGFHAALNNTPSGIEVRIEWRGAGAEVARTTNSVFTPGTAYEPFSLTATAPANADTARVVYALQSFGGSATAVVNVDDVSVIPEPTSSLLAALGALGLIRRRR